MGESAMKFFAAFMVFALLVAMLYGIIDIWGTLKKILQELREINGKIQKTHKHDYWNETPPATQPPSKADRDLSEVFERLEHDLHDMKNPRSG
jgi:hypothetical protein